MQTQLTEAGPFERMLTLTLDESELDDAKTAAARKLSQDMKIKGFRPGKAPRAVVERMVGAEALRSEAIDEALPEAVTDALREEELSPVTAPRVEDMRDVDGGGVEVDVRITLWPTVDEAPDFEGRKIEVEIPEVEDSEVGEQIDRLRNQFAELEDVERAADEGDFVMVNITALDGDTQIEDASADDLLYEVGSQSFLGGLDELVLGSSSGDIRKGPGVLPPGFTDHEGEVTLSVLVKGVKGKKLPEVNDEWVSDITEFETVDELREQLQENLYAMKLNVTGQQFRESLMDDLITELDIELPDALVDAEMENSFHNLSHSLENQGIDFGNYLRITGQDQEEFLAELRERSSDSIKSRILLDTVATSQEITVEDEELEGAIQALAAQSGEEVVEVKKALAQSGQVVALAGDILRRKALNHILEQASPVDADGEPVDLTPPGFEEAEEEAAADDSGDGGDVAEAEETDSAPASSEVGREIDAEQADEDSTDEADE